MKFLTGTLVNEINDAYKKRRNGKRYKPLRTALDSLLSGHMSEREAQQEEADSTSDGYLSSKVDQGFMGQYDSDSSGNGTRLKGHTGIFSQDFPTSPKVSKEKGKKSTLGVDISEGTSGTDEVRTQSQKSKGMGIEASKQSSVLLNIEEANNEAGEGNDCCDEMTSTVNVMESEGDEYLPPSGTELCC